MSIHRHCVILFGFVIAGACLMSSAPYKILFVGDTSFGESYQVEYEPLGQGNILKEKGYDYSLARIRPLLMQADLVIANLETPVTDLPVSPFAGTKTYVHWTDVKLAPKHLKSHNIKVVSLANNHSLDFGAAGLRQTLDVLRANEIEVVGAGLDEEEAAKPSRKDIKIGDRVFKLAVLAPFEYRQYYDQKYDYYARENRAGAYALSLKKLSRQIARLKAADHEVYVVVFPHWGGNYVWKNDEQTRLARGLIDAGADLIIGHGAHMMQEIELYHGRWIVYSLGNFMFNSAGRYELKKVDPFSLVVELLVRETDGRLEKSIRLYPTFTDNQKTNYQSRPVTEEEFQNVRNLLLTKSLDPARLKKDVRTGKDELGCFLEFTVQ